MWRPKNRYVDHDLGVKTTALVSRPSDCGLPLGHLGGGVIGVESRHMYASVSDMVWPELPTMTAMFATIETGAFYETVRTRFYSKTHKLTTQATFAADCRR